MATNIPSLHIGEVARQTGLTVDAIRFYEKERLLRQSPRTSGGFRLFNAQDVERVQFIRQVQELGFSLGEVKELLVLRGGSVEACSRVQGLSEQKLAKVRHHIRELHKLEDELKSAVQQCDAAKREVAAIGNHARSWNRRVRSGMGGNED